MIDGVSVGQRAFESLRSAVDAVVVSVRRRDSDLARFAIANGAAVVVLGDAPGLTANASGMGNSLSAAAWVALDAYPQAPWWIVALADMPWVQADTVHAIVAYAQTICPNGAHENANANANVNVNARASAHAIVRPRYRGTPGHPIALSRSLGAELRACSGDIGAREIIQRYREHLHWLDVADPGVTLDVDLPTDLQSFRSP